MFSTQDLPELLAWREEDDAPILSVYIDRRTGTGFWNAEDLAPLVKGLVKDVPENGDWGSTALEEATHVVLAALAGGIWTERSVAVFANPRGRVKTLEWNLAVASQARWADSPYLLPLLDVVGEKERWGVVLVDRARARLFTVASGTIEEELSAFNPERVQRADATGRDQALTMNLQRKADEHAHLHYKHVAAILDEMSRDGRFGRWMLGGPTDSVGGLRDTLSPRLAEQLGGILHLPVEAAKEDVVAAALDLARRLEEGRGDAEVRAHETASAKKEKAAAGLDGTLDALREGRIRRLLYADGLALRGRRCARCGSLFDETAKRCRYCQGNTSPVDDLLNEMAGRVAKGGGRVESVGSPGAQRLRRLGGVGAFLRF
jgi:peptide chain release factor subunit 1